MFHLKCAGIKIPILSEIVLFTKKVSPTKILFKAKNPSKNIEFVMLYPTYCLSLKDQIVLLWSYLKRNYIKLTNLIILLVKQIC